MDKKYDLRKRDSIHKTSPKKGPQELHKDAHDAASYTETGASEETGSVRRRTGGSARPRSAAGSRTPAAPPPGWNVQLDAELTEDEDPPLPADRSFRDGGPGSSGNTSGHRTPPPSPRRTPEPTHIPGGTCRLSYRPEAADPGITSPDPGTSPSDLSDGQLIGAILAVSLIVLACAIGVYWYWGSDSRPPRVDVADSVPLKAGVERWREEVAVLARRFPFQRPHLWRVLRAAVSHMLLEASRPAVVILLASEAQRDDTQCLLRAAAAAVINATGSSWRPLLVDGAALGALDQVEAKGRLDAELGRLRDGAGGVAVLAVEELQQLQPLTAMLLHGFCDNDNAPRKHALFLLSVVTARTPPGDTDLDRAVEHALWQAWGHALSEDIFHALLARIAGNVAVVADEGSQLFCHKASSL